MAKSITDEEENLTPPKEDESENPSAGIEPENSDEAELSPKDKAGFQRLVAKRDAETKAEKDARLKAEAEAGELRKKLKDRELADLSDIDRATKQAQEAVEENARLKLQMFVKDEVAARKLDTSDPLIEILMDTPWASPPIKRILGDSPTWEEVVSVVKEKLPAYLDSLVARKKTEVSTPTEGEELPDNGEEEEIPPPPTSTERTISTPTTKRYWTRSEIASMNDEEYLKHAKDIRKALAEGRVLNR
jgi:hypothetical protein